MSEEVFRIMRGLDMCGLETQVALQCAPLLTGIKASNLLNVGAEKREEVSRLFEKTPISFQVLYEHAGRISVLLYRKERLEACLRRNGERELLCGLGYEDMELEEILSRVSVRYQSHMEGAEDSPMKSACFWNTPPVTSAALLKRKAGNFCTQVTGRCTAVCRRHCGHLRLTTERERP